MDGFCRRYALRQNRHETHGPFRVRVFFTNVFAPHGDGEVRDKVQSGHAP